MIPELFLKFFGSLTRYALVGVVTWMVSKGMLSDDLGTEVLSWAAVTIPTVIWGIYSKYKDHLQFLAALKLPAHATPEDAKALAGKITITGEAKPNA